MTRGEPVIRELIAREEHPFGASTGGADGDGRIVAVS
jgi:hypothetical protein